MLADFPLLHPARISQSDCANDFFRYLSAFVFLASCCAVLAGAILHVDLLVAQEKMVGANTSRDVAAMQDACSRWDWADTQFVSDSMSGLRRMAKSAVSVTIDAANPQPASLSLFDARQNFSGVDLWQWLLHFFEQKRAPFE